MIAPNPGDEPSKAMGYIYKITCPDGKVYIGQTTKTPEERFKGHTRPSNGSQLAIRGRECGWGNMVLEILEKVANDLLDDREIALIDEYDSVWPNGYNVTKGGRGAGCRPAVFPQATRDKMSKSGGGWKGKKQTPEHIQKTIDTKMSRDPEITKAIYDGIADSNRGQTRSQETRDKLSILALNRPPITDDTRTKLSDSGKLWWREKLVLEDNYFEVFKIATGAFVGIYLNQSQCCNELDIKDRGHFCETLNNDRARSQTNGYTARYVNNTIQSVLDDIIHCIDADSMFIEEVQLMVINTLQFITENKRLPSDTITVPPEERDLAEKFLEIKLRLKKEDKKMSSEYTNFQKFLEILDFQNSTKFS